MEDIVSTPKRAVLWRASSGIFGGLCAGLLALSAAFVSSTAFAQSSAPAPVPSAARMAASGASPVAQHDLSAVSLEDLMNIEVTSVSKKAEKISQAAAAIFVITQEDISRSGATNIPDLLRMVPGLDVSQINANDWAISARGFNQQFSNKLLVLIDGRAVYTPLLGGVNWDTQDVPLEDIERIEVIRGPGATIWGANAVNGVINIVSKDSADTKGGLITALGGPGGRLRATTQYGGEIGAKTNYRVFVDYLNQNFLQAPEGGSGNDSWHLLHGGFRADSNLSTNDSLTVQGDVYTGKEDAEIIHLFSVDPPTIGDLNVRSELGGGNILARWNHIFSSRSDTTLQFYFDNYERTGPESIETRNTIDIDFNHHFRWGSRQDIVWGAGYRHTWDDLEGTIDEAFNPPDTRLRLFNVFVQDTITLQPDRLFLTVGTKAEDSYFTGFDLQPSVRLAWTPANWLTFWSAVSRAERTPDRRDVNLVASLAAFPDPAGSTTPVEVILFGNPQFQAEHVLAYELGFRAQPNRWLSVDVSTFFNRYEHLESHEMGQAFFQPSPAPARFVIPLSFGNLLYGTTEGGEISAKLKLTDRWTLSPGYAFLEMHLHTKPSSNDDQSVAESQGSSPQHQAQLRSHVDLSHGFSWDADAYFVSALPAQAVPSHTRVDTQVRWKFAERAEFSVVGQNLVRDHHLESMDALTLVNSSLIKRSAYAKFTWRFW
jgi:iron complex outermembrane receptor protein